MWIYDPRADYLHRDNYGILRKLLKGDEKTVENVWKVSLDHARRLPRHEALAFAQWVLSGAVDRNLAKVEGSRH